MSTNEDDKEEYFLRASLLLLKGGGLMSKETLSREVQKAGINLDVLLKTHKGKLKHKFSKEQRNKLCLDGGTTCVEQWDLAMLTKVPLTVFNQSLNDDEKKALKCIKHKRDTVYAHTHSSVLSFDDYDDIRKELEEALGVLSNGLSDNVKDECAKIIQQCTTGPMSPSVKAELSKQLKGTEDLVKAVMVKLTDTHKVLLDMRNDIVDLTKIVTELKGHHTPEDGSPKKVTGRFEPLIGTSVNIYYEREGYMNLSSGREGHMTTVGPIVTIYGYDEKCFITTGGGKIDHLTAVSGQSEALKVLAYNPNLETLLIAPVGCHLFTVPQMVEVTGYTDYITSRKTVLKDLHGERVFKVGATSGLTYGVITDLGVRFAFGTAQEQFMSVMLVTSLSGENPFAESGDGGALVFQGNKEHWSCVGMVIGGTSFGACAVKPIAHILEGIERCIGRPIALDIPFMAPQVSAILDNVKL